MKNIEEQYRKPNLASEPFFYFNSDKLDENIAFVKKNKIVNLTLIPNPDGYNLKNLDFLKELPFIKNIGMGTCKQIDNYDGLSFLQNLETLGIAPDKKVRVDLSNLVNLKSLAFTYTPKITGFERLKNLETLIAGSGSDEFYNIDIFSNFKRLKTLTLAQAIITNLNFLKENTILEKLTFTHMRRSFDLEGIQNLKNSLKKLSFSSSKKISNVELISELVNLEWLIFSDSIVLENAEFIKNLKKLEALSVGGSSYFIDGDLRSIKHLKDTIKYFTVRDKKHYFYE